MSSETPTEGRCNATTRDGGHCENYPKGDSGRCRMHGADAGAPDGNQNAVTVGAWAEDFYEGFLTESEQKRVNEMARALGDETTAKELGQHVATLSLEQFRRTGDERFLRRFESICDKFGIAPADELNVEGELSTDNIVVNFEDVDT